VDLIHRRAGAALRHAARCEYLAAVLTVPEARLAQD